MYRLVLLLSLSKLLLLRLEYDNHY